jgi:asparagine synthase (glutamine-hydrolysing)
MCGICGEMTFGRGGVRMAVIEAMRDRLVHRGPDDQGVYVSADARAGLGFRRLAILDLRHDANQPMAGAGGAVQLVFNGEIYNFQELRAGLEQRGHRFRTTSDTEVIVRLYEDRGSAFVDALDGMFALAIWDERSRRLLLARDRAGKKPLFYFRDNRRVVFGSEMKALFAHPEVRSEIDAAALPAFFQFGYVPHPATLYRGVHQVPPASVVEIDADGMTTERRYWRLQQRAAGDAPRIGRADARARVRALVTDAVRKRLISDVPLGAFLSAGIDSTIVVGVMRTLTREPVKTFTIGFEGDAAYDETAPAGNVAARFGTDHRTFRVAPSAVELIDRLVWHYDGPFGDSSAIPTFLLSELTRRHVTVVLTGDGGDELFAGYMRFRAALAAERLPAAAGAWLGAALRALPRPPNERHLLARAQRFARFMHLPLVERAARWNSLFADDVSELLTPDVYGTHGATDPLAHLRADLDAAAGASPLGQLLAANFASYLPDDLLVKTDRCTMAHSLEARSPLLDTALAEYAGSLPDDFKLSRGRGKAILREAFSDLVPPDIDRRPKTGFGVPLDRWFRTELRDFVRDTLLEPSAALRAYVRQDRVRTLIDDHLAGRINAGQRLWTLVSFERWLRLLPEWRAAQVTAP